MIKQFVTAVLAVGAVSTATAQEQAQPEANMQPRFGVKAALNSSTYNYEGFATELTSVRTWMVGGVVDIPLSSAFFVGTGVEVTSKGAKRSTSIVTISASPIYLQVPVKLNFRTSNWNFGVGPYFGYGIAGEFTATALGLTQTESINFDDNDPDGMSPLDLGICAEVGYTIDNFRFGGHLYNGLSNTLPKVARSDDDFIGNFQVGVMIGYMF